MGNLAPGDNEAPYLVVTGYYMYIGEDGVKYQVNYVADNTGYHPYISSPLIDDKDGELPPPAHLPPKAINSLLGG